MELIPHIAHMKEAMTIPKTASILILTVARTLINMNPRRSYLLHMAIMRQIFPLL